MLKLKEIKKDYISGDTTVHALKGIDLEFRENEFVAILGHSGCGKTTMLNIIGGLDQYSSGDLVINGKSTKNFTDGDWDAYRNHSIGFVFQSYNLIPHQTVLSNVELALTLSGVGAAERKQRATEALVKVGLGDQIHKKPNQMSGGQMQRVAIARALVNNPDILLADEPTGALDTETSVQIMELLKEISKDKLIIMVTHNPELATDYASRIIRLKDGTITDDSNPYNSGVDELNTDNKRHKTSMSFWTALSLSMNNLLTKKTRTLLTAFAGSIGIIGIALILSLSNGIQNYIDKVQEDTLSSYPITIEAETVDMTSMMTSLMGAQAAAIENRHEKDAVYSSTIMYDLMNSMISADKQTNNLAAFKAHLDSPDNEITPRVSAIQYSYNLDMNIYAEDVDGNVVKTDMMGILTQAMSDMYGGDYSSYFSTFGSYYSMADVWQEMLPDVNGNGINPLLKDMYDVIYGRWPENYDEVVLIVNGENEVSDLVLYALGLKSNSHIADDMEAFMNQTTVEASVESWSYEDICSLDIRYIYPADQYQWDEETEEYINLADEEIGLRTLYNNGMPIKITGIIRVNEDATGGMMNGSIGYTHALIEHIISEASEKELVKKQLADPNIEVFTSLPYLDEDDAMTSNLKIEAAKDYIDAADEEKLAKLYIDYVSNPTDEYVEEMLDEQMKDVSRADIEKMIGDMYPGYASMIADMDDDTLMDYMRQMAVGTVKEQYAAQMRELYEYLPDSQLAEDFSLLALEDDDYLWIYDNAMPPVYSTTNLKSVLKTLGYVDLTSPSKINIYASTFEDKDEVGAAIGRYNDKVAEEDEIKYTDLVAVLMSSITTIINVISYVLIAFVAISLVVSSIMIGIITYISVLERTKEIGILRAIGASKRDVSRVFNAETGIIGFTAGAIGIGMTLLLNIPINIIVHKLTDIYSINSELPAVGGIALVIISVGLTFIAGLIPSGMAAKKDPVEALRSE